MMKRCIAIFCTCAFSAGFAWPQAVSSDVNASVNNAEVSSRVDASVASGLGRVQGATGIQGATRQGSTVRGNALGHNTGKMLHGNSNSFGASHPDVFGSDATSRRSAIPSIPSAGREVQAGVANSRNQASSPQLGMAGGAHSASGLGQSSIQGDGGFPDTTRQTYWPTPPFYGPPSALSFNPQAPTWSPTFGTDNLKLSYRAGKNFSGFHWTKKFHQHRYQVTQEPVDPLTGLDSNTRSGTASSVHSVLKTGLPQYPLEGTLDASGGGD